MDVDHGLFRIGRYWKTGAAHLPENHAASPCIQYAKYQAFEVPMSTGLASPLGLTYIRSAMPNMPSLFAQPVTGVTEAGGVIVPRINTPSYQRTFSSRTRISSG